MLKPLLLFSLLCASCVTTRPHNAFIRMDGARVGVSRQDVFLHPYEPTAAIRAAMDTAGIAVMDSVSVRHRVRWSGWSYVTTVIGK